MVYTFANRDEIYKTQMTVTASTSFVLISILFIMLSLVGSDTKLSALLSLVCITYALIYKRELSVNYLQLNKHKVTYNLT